MININRVINSKIIKTDMPFGDILIPLNKREGFANGRSPVFPIYFCSYIGIKKNSDEYHNDLYKLDKLLSNLKNQYSKYISNIPFQSNPELMRKTGNLWNNLEPFTEKKKLFLLSSIKLVKALPEFPNKLLQSSVENAFNEVFNLYFANTKNINTTKAKNFVMKLLTWIHSYVPNLLQDMDFLNNNQNEIYNPKIIYYGNIKVHEIYFLIFLSKIGCDILYINSTVDSEENFKNICTEDSYSNVIKLQNEGSLKPFPSNEIIARTETVAYKASNELEEILYNEEDGLYKPWQFENYNVHPVTLKTTYDELKILWNEDAKFRDGFKVKNNTVYLPNMFVKISGVPEDINSYWSDLSYFYHNENAKLISKVPFTEITYSKQDLYKLVFLFDEVGYLNKEALEKYEPYKFSYLKTSLQNTIFKKINQLFELPLFKKQVDKEFKLKILMTILTLDKSFIDLLQCFDYPFKIPKLILYDNNENIYSDEDSIILAFLALIGIDILIVTPTGYNNIENKIPEKYYDIHKFEKVSLNLELPNLNNIKKKENSFWSKLFKR